MADTKPLANLTSEWTSSLEHVIRFLRPVERAKPVVDRLSCAVQIMSPLPNVKELKLEPQDRATQPFICQVGFQGILRVQLVDQQNKVLSQSSLGRCFQPGMHELNIEGPGSGSIPSQDKPEFAFRCLGVGRVGFTFSLIYKPEKGIIIDGTSTSARNVSAAQVFRGAQELIALVFAQDGKAQCNQDKVDIDGDVNRNGKVEDSADDSDDDEKGETAVGLIVVRNADSVYRDKVEPARRREIVVRSRAKQVLVSRSSKEQILLFDKENKGAELFGDKDEVGLAPGTYWLQGGSQASTGVRKDFLRVRLTDKDPVADEIKVTVIWVDIDGRISGATLTDKDGVYDKFQALKTIFGHDKLGVRRATDGSSKGNLHVAGLIQLVGTISPVDLRKTSFDKKLTTGLKRAKKGVASNTADFGFNFRRFVTFKTWANGGVKDAKGEKESVAALAEATDKPDDSLPGALDVEPDLLADKPVIVDMDGPGASITTADTAAWYIHDRNNFLNHVVFFNHSGVAERCSEKLQWSYTADFSIAIDDNKATFIFDKPNDGAGTNELFLKKAVSLDLDLAAGEIAKAEVDGGGNKIRQNVRTQINLEGKNLAGLWRLVKRAAPQAGAEVAPTQVRVRRTEELAENVGSFSNLTEAFLIIRTESALGAYDLKLASVKGVVTGPIFEIVR